MSIFKKSLDELAKVMPIVDKKIQSIFVGGSDSQQAPQVSGSSNCPNSCVVNCFDYLDGSQYDACHYYTEFKNEYGITPGPSGGVPTNCISEIGAYGGFNVTEANIGEPISVGGIATFNVSGSIGHAVVIIEFYQNVDGTYKIKYHDPTSNEENDIDMSQFTGLYNVTHTGQSGSL